MQARLAASSLSQHIRGMASEPATAHEKAPPQLPPYDYKPRPYTGPSKEEVLALRKQYLSPCRWCQTHTSPAHTDTLCWPVLVHCSGDPHGPFSDCLCMWVQACFTTSRSQS